MSIITRVSDNPRFVKSTAGDYFTLPNCRTVRLDGDARIGNGVKLSGHACVARTAEVWGYAVLRGDCHVAGEVCGRAVISGNAYIGPSGRVRDRAQVRGGEVFGTVSGNAIVHGGDIGHTSYVSENAVVYTGAEVVASSVQGDCCLKLGACVHSCGKLTSGTITGDLMGGRVIGRWGAHPVSATRFRVGCQIYTYEQWLDPSSSSVVPWDGYTNKKQKAAIQAYIRFVQEQQKLYPSFAPIKKVKKCRAK